MSCKFSISYPERKEELVEKLRTAIIQVNGSFNGDVNSGAFQGNTPLGGFSGRYVVEGDDIHVEVDEKPFLIGCSRIEKEIREYLSRGNV